MQRKIDESETTFDPRIKRFYTLVEIATFWFDLPLEEEGLRAITQLTAKQRFFLESLSSAVKLGDLIAYINGYPQRGFPVGEIPIPFTIERDDLKNWIRNNVPEETPSFLFDEIEQGSLVRIQKKELEKLYAEHVALKSQVVLLQKQNDELKTKIQSPPPNFSGSPKPLDKREKDSLLAMLGALGKLKDVNFEERGFCKQISRAVLDLGGDLSEGAILKHLKSIPSAIEDLGLHRKSL